MKKNLLTICILIITPMLLLGNEIDIKHSDFIERTINFIIFVAILWYLLKNKIKFALKDRQDKIASQLNAVQDRLIQSKIKKEEAIKSLEDSKKFANEIIANAKKEANIITTNIQKQCKNDIAIINKHHQELLLFEQKRIKRMVISEVLDELLSDKNIKLDKKDYINILAKKVA